MQISFEVLAAVLITPILSAVAALFWLLIRTQNNRLEDYKERVEKYDKEILPAMRSIEQALVKLTDLYEKQQKERA